jgi:hypothetical protein
MNWSQLNDLLSVVANFAAVITAAVALIAGTRFLYRAIKRRRALESLLKRVRAHDEEYSVGGKGERTILYLMAHLAMTESQVLDAAFSSRRVKRWLANDPKSGRSNAMYFQYDPKGGPAEITDYMDRINETLKRNELWNRKARPAEPTDHKDIPT